jgi:uncharacterized circularly permuted ATP-grasp superfamily protein
MDREPIFDEFAAADGTVRHGWSALLTGLDEFADTDLLHAQREVARLLEDDNVTYTPSPASTISIADEPNGHGPPNAAAGLAEPQPWRLDPLPLISGLSCWTRSSPTSMAPADCCPGGIFRPKPFLIMTNT